jgi:MoaA/NifB/PqqE/SkfB family radical SAM enzyme/glycosyltransferase involved in cell wall biosynthesis
MDTTEHTTGTPPDSEEMISRKHGVADMASVLLKMIFTYCRPALSFEFYKDGPAMLPALSREARSRVVCFGPTDGETAGSAQPQVEYLTGESRKFDFANYFESVDLVLLEDATGDDLLYSSMYAFKMIKPGGVIAWRRPRVLDPDRRLGFEKINTRFPLYHLDDAGLTLHCPPEVWEQVVAWDAANLRALELSVLIPTHNGAERITPTLDSALQQTLPSDLYEIIVIDNNSNDQTADVIQDYIKRYGNRIRYVHEPAPGLGNARHAGARAARGRILCYLDDDAVADKVWLMSIREAFNNPEVALVGGKILPRFGIEPPPWLERFWHLTPTGRTLGMLSLIDLGEPSREVNPDYIWGCNYAVRKEVLFKAGGFHPDALPAALIRYRGDGEVGLSRKIKQLGYRAWYHPKALVHHVIPADRLKPSYFLKRQFNQGISDSYTCIRNEGPPDRCEATPDLLETMQQFRESIAAGTFDRAADDPAEFDELMLASYEFGKLYHIHQVCADPELLKHVRCKDYLAPGFQATPVTADRPAGEDTDATGDSAQKRAGDNYRAAFWLADIGLHSLAVEMLDQAERSGIKIVGVDFVRALSLVEIGRFKEAAAALRQEPPESPFRDQVEPLRQKIWSGNRKMRDALLTSGAKIPESEINNLPLTLENAVLYITEMCNSRCITCHAWKIKSENKLPTESWKLVLERLRSIGIRTVEFVGGEPLLRKDLTELAAEARRLGFTGILVSTNGFLLTAERLAQCLSAGVNSFHVSLDGFHETYRAIRGRDWSDNIRKTLVWIAESNAELLVLTILTRRNLAELEDIVSFVSDIGARWFPNILESGKYLFKGVDTSRLTITESKEVEDLVTKLKSLKARFPHTVSIGMAEIDYLHQYLTNLSKESLIPCTTGFDSIYLDPEANLYTACMSLKPIGNLLKEPPAALIDSTQMRQRLLAMVRRHCPGCTCGYTQRAGYMANTCPLPT